MIKIQLDNVLANRIGKEHGISDKKLQNLIKKHQNLVADIFRKKKKDGYAFVELPDQEALIRKINKYTRDQKKHKWENIVVLGIGGSALGLITLKEALLNEFDQKPRLFVLDNVDPVMIGRTLNEIKIKKTLFIVISKSGTTVEPMALYNIVRPLIIKKVGKNFSDHLLFITDKKRGLLRQIVRTDKIQTFDIPDAIGGRFSVLTSVGLVPAALAGIDYKKLLKGAATMRGKIKQNKGVKNPALILACIQYLMDREKKRPMTILMPYSNSLFRVGDWYRQLLAESIGKNRRTGPTPINALGSTDQHSQVQLYMEGPHDKWIMFMKVINHKTDLQMGYELPEEMSFLNGKYLSQVMHASHHGTSEALADNERPNLTITLNKIDEESIGQLFMLFEFQVALLGEMYKINTFNQPGVEQGKVISKKLLMDEAT